MVRMKLTDYWDDSALTLGITLHWQCTDLCGRHYTDCVDDTKSSMWRTLHWHVDDSKVTVWLTLCYGDEDTTACLDDTISNAWMPVWWTLVWKVEDITVKRGKQIRGHYADCLEDTRVTCEGHCSYCVEDTTETYYILRSGPLLCTTPSRRCCLLVLQSGRMVCPRFC